MRVRPGHEPVNHRGMVRCFDNANVYNYWFESDEETEAEKAQVKTLQCIAIMSLSQETGTVP